MVARTRLSVTLYVHCLSSLIRLSKSTVVPVHSHKASGGVKARVHSLLILALDGDEWSTSRSDRSIPGKYTCLLSLLFKIYVCRLQKCHYITLKPTNMNACSRTHVWAQAYATGAHLRIKVCTLK
jgi:hypothetical protein